MSPDHRQHRGAHPEDRKLFAPERIATLRQAASDLGWLLERAYAPTAALKLVGDRYTLDERQRMAVFRASCSASQSAKRQTTCLPVEQIRGQDIQIDGFNLLITVEAALGNGLILHCGDACLRDLASIHSTYKAVQETVPALTLIGNALHALAPRSVQWLLDSPVSNSGRLAQTIRELGAEEGWNWEAVTVLNPDTVLKASEQIVVTSDSAILDKVGRWINLAAYLLPTFIPDAWIIDLRASEE